MDLSIVFPTFSTARVAVIGAMREIVTLDRRDVTRRAALDLLIGVYQETGAYENAVVEITIIGGLTGDDVLARETVRASGRRIVRLAYRWDDVAANIVKKHRSNGRDIDERAIARLCGESGTLRAAVVYARWRARTKETA
jgi:hypothetical protein